FRLAQLPAHIQSRREREYAESGPEGRTNQDLEEKSYCSGTAGAYLDSALSQNKARHNLVFLAGSASQWFLRKFSDGGKQRLSFLRPVAQWVRFFEWPGSGVEALRSPG